MMTFGMWLQQRRKSLDLTREALARQIGCSASLVRKLESDTRKPSKQIAQLLAEHLQVVPEQHEQFVQFARGLTGSNGAQPEHAWQTRAPHAAASTSSSRFTEIASQQIPRPSNPAAEPDSVSSVPHFRLQPAAVRPTNLPRSLTALLGREHEVQTLRNRVLRDDVRLITLVGPPGIGKTQLALVLAQGLLPAFEDGVFLVPLAPLSDPQLVAAAILQALHLSSSADLPARLALKHLLRDKQLLLVLDNFEQVLPAADVVAELLAECAYVKVIATSREPLRIRGERQFGVPALAMPTPEHLSSAPPMSLLLDYPAVALFVERAQAVDAAFQLDETSAAAILEICQSVDGIPLGIELAASWVNALSCAEIAQEIRHNLDFLSTSMHDMPARHRSLRAAFDHSWNLLPAHEQAVLSRLSVFRGGLTREAAEAVAGATLADLSALIAKSLLRRSEAGRYDLHEFIRQYAAEKLQASMAGVEGASVSRRETQRAHLLFYLTVARQALAQSETIGADETLWLDRLDDEHDNIRAALDWAAADTEAEDALALGLALAGALWFFWYVRGHLTEGAERLRQLLAVSNRRRNQPRPDTTAPHLQALLALGWVEAVQLHFDNARQLLDQVLTQSRAAHDWPTIAWTLTFVAYIANVENDLTVARMAAEESMAIWHRLGDERRSGWPLRMLADNALRAGDYSRAQAAFSQMLMDEHQTSNQVFALRRLGKVMQRQGDYGEARTLLRQALQLSLSVQDRIGVVACVAGLASVALADDRPEVSARLYGVVEGLLDTLNTVLESFDRAEKEREMAVLQRRVAPDVLEGWLRESREWPQERAMAYALGGEAG